MALDIIVIDDNSSIRTFLDDLFSSEGHKPKSFANTEDCIRYLEEDHTLKPQAYFVDLHMPESEHDGEYLLNYLKDNNYKTSKFYFITGSIDNCSKLEASTGKKVIKKPFQIDYLLSVLE